MFTGIVEEVGRVVKADEGRLRIEATFAASLLPGQSVCINGACLTVTAAHAETFGVTAVQETLRKTTLGLLRPGSRVNLERAMPANGRFEGHIVQGHVDGTCRIEAVQREGENRLYTFESPPNFLPYLIPRGSITLDGISLTLAHVAPPRFTVAIIPFTHMHTTARDWQQGTRTNMECDAIGKYVVHFLAATSK